MLRVALGSSLAKGAADLTIASLQGGMNDTDPEHAIADDEAVLMENVELYHSTVGERRAGCTPMSLTSSGMTDEAVIAHLSQWLPTNSAIIPEYWAVGVTPGVSATIAKNIYTTWLEITPNDALALNVPDLYYIQSQPLSNLLFWAYRSAQNRLHVWDGTNWRRTGVAQPAPPTGADHGSGSYATVRYFRVRYIARNISTTVLRRSEPSTALTITPSGSGDGITLTKPAAINEGETHWEVEASTDNATFYRITTLAIATTTYLDTTAFASGYASQGPVSEVIGTYLLQPSAKYLSVDGDRLLLAGHWTDPSLQSTVWWTPVSADPGVGNSERLPLDFNNSRNLDGYEGGAITGISSATYGVWHVFKWSHIYQMVRTGDVTNAYNVVTLSKNRGAIPGTIIVGADRSGNPCTYFIDPELGPSRLGAEGLQVIIGLDTTWKRVNLLADIVAVGVYYADKKQIKWAIAVDGASTPNYEIKLQVSENVSNGGTVSRGWTVSTGRSTQAYTMTILTEQVFIDGRQTLSHRPYVGLTAPDYIQRCDVGTRDAGVPYVATIRTKPFMLANLLNKWGAMVGALLAQAVDGAHVVVRLIRDFGLEDSTTIEVDMSPVGDETSVVRIMDDLRMSNATAIQIEISDE